MKKILCMALFFGISSLSYSKTEMEEKIDALEVLKKYSETVACATSFEEIKSVRGFLKDVHTIERDSELGLATYFILWGGDMGCNGGSGTHSQIISEVGRIDENKPFLVRNNDAFGEDFNKSVNPRFIEKLQKIDVNKFVVISSEHIKDDANNFPSNKYQYTLEQKDWKWKVTSKKFLGKNK